MRPVDRERVMADKALLERIERRRADIAEHHPDRADGEGGELFVMALLVMAVRRMRVFHRAQLCPRGQARHKLYAVFMRTTIFRVET